MKVVEKILFYILLFLICFMGVICAFTYINCNKIKDGNKYVKLHEKVIDYVIEDLEIDDFNYIAINTNNLKLNTTKQQTSLVNGLRKYNANILLGSKDILNDESLKNDSDFNNGIYIYTDNLKLYANIVTETLKLEYKGKVYEYNVYAVYYFDKWHISYPARSE